MKCQLCRTNEGTVQYEDGKYRFSVCMECYDEEKGSRWDNGTCIGYVMLALKELDYSETKTEEIINELHELFHKKTVKQAKEYFQKH